VGLVLLIPCSCCGFSVTIAAVAVGLVLLIHCSCCGFSFTIAAVAVGLVLLIHCSCCGFGFTNPLQLLQAEFRNRSWTGLSIQLLILGLSYLSVALTACCSGSLIWINFCSI
jgi:hypothetical protein